MSGETKTLVDRLKALAEKATDGPWHACGDPLGEPLDASSLGSDMPPMRQRKDLCSCGQVWSVPKDCPLIYVEGGNWGDRYPAIRTKDDGSLEAYQEMIVYGSIPREAQQANMAFVAACRDGVPTLCDEIIRLERELAEARRERDESDAVVCFNLDPYQITNTMFSIHKWTTDAVARHRAAREKEQG